MFAGMPSAFLPGRRAGHVRVNGMRVKPAHSVRAGDEVRRQDDRERVVVVVLVIVKRAGAPVAAECYVDRSPPPLSREETVTAQARIFPPAARLENREPGGLP